MVRRVIVKNVVKSSRVQTNILLHAKYSSTNNYVPQLIYAEFYVVAIHGTY